MNDDGDARTTYAQLASFIDDHTDGTEDGHLKINTMTGGSVTEHLHIGNNKISGSATTTGSFGKLLGDASDSFYAPFNSETAANRIDEALFFNLPVGLK